MKFLTFIFCYLLILSVNLKSQTPEWTVYKTTNSAIPFNKAFDMAIDRTNNVWICYDNSGNFPHLACFDGADWLSFINDSWVNCITVDNENTVWVVTSGRKLISIKEWVLTPYTSSMFDYPWASELFADSYGNKWIFANHELFKFDGSNWEKFTSENSILPSSDITEIAQLNDEVWFSFAGGGLARWQNNTFELINTTNSTLPNDTIYSMIVHNGTLWHVNAQNQLISFSGENFAINGISVLPDYASIKAIDKSGRFWFLSSDGVIIYDGTSTQIYNKDNSPLGTNQLLSLCIDSTNSVWIGTWGQGLVKYRDDVSSVEDLNNLKNQFGIFPNPVTQNAVLKFNLDTETHFSISVYDLLGNKVKNITDFQAKPAEYELNIELKELIVGSYFLVINLSGKSQIIPFIKL